MKIILHILFFLFLSLATFAQEQNIQWSEIIPIKKNSVVKTILNNKQAFYVVQSLRGKKLTGIQIDKFTSSSLVLEKSVVLNYPVIGNGKAQHEQMLLKGGKLIWLLTNFDRVSRKHALYQITISADLGTLSEAIKIDEYNIESSKSLPGYTFHSEETGNFNLICRKFPFDKYSKEKFYFYMMDSNFRQIWKKEIELPYANNLLNINQKFIDHKGNVHLLATLAPEKQKNELFNRRIAVDKYLLISFYPLENKVKEFEISLDGKFITSVTAGVNPAGNIAIGGFYSNTNEFTLAGTFYLLISAENKKIITLNQKAFDKDFLMEFMSEKSANNGEELTDFYFDHFILNEDGSAMLIAEEYFKQTYTYFDPYNQLYYDNNTYNFNTIIVVKVNMNGEITQTHKINKRQISNTGYNNYLSYTIAKGDSTLYVMFNDHSGNFKNKNSDQANALTTIKFAVPALVTIQNNGKNDKSILFEDNKNNLVLLPSLCRQLDNSTYLLCRSKRKYMQFGTFKLN